MIRKSKISFTRKPKTSAAIVRKPKVTQWNPEPKITVREFIRECYRLRTERNDKAQQAYLTDEFLRLSGKSLGDRAELRMIDYVWAKLQITAWLTYCETPEKSQEFLNRYNSIMSRSTVGLDDITAAIIHSYRVAQNEEARTTGPAKRRSSIMSATPKKIVKKIVSKPTQTQLTKKPVVVNPMKKSVDTTPTKKIISKPNVVPTKKPATKNPEGGRELVFGKYPITAVARWFGANGFSSSDAFNALTGLGLDPNRSTVNIQCSAGKAGQRGEPAPLTGAEIKQLKGLVKASAE